MQILPESPSDVSIVKNRANLPFSEDEEDAVNSQLHSVLSWRGSKRRRELFQDSRRRNM